MLCSSMFRTLLNFDLLVRLLRPIFMLNDDHTERTLNVLDKAAKFFEVLFKSPHLLFGAVLWAFGGHWLIAVSGVA